MDCGENDFGQHGYGPYGYEGIDTGYEVRGTE